METKDKIEAEAEAVFGQIKYEVACAVLDAAAERLVRAEREDKQAQRKEY